MVDFSQANEGSAVPVMVEPKTHLIIHGDVGRVLKSLPDNSVDVVITAPPRTLKTATLLAIMQQMRHLLKETAQVWMVLDHPNTARAIREAPASDGLWLQLESRPHRGLYMFAMTNSVELEQADRERVTKLDGNAPPVNAPEPIPLPWIDVLVDIASKEGGTVLDPFCVTGSVGAMANWLGRNTYLITDTRARANEIYRRTQKALKARKEALTQAAQEEEGEAADEPGEPEGPAPGEAPDDGCAPAPAQVVLEMPPEALELAQEGPTEAPEEPAAPEVPTGMEPAQEPGPEPPAGPPICSGANWAVVNGDSRTVLQCYPDACFDSVVTDPPYGLSEHDAELVAEALRCWMVGKPFVSNRRGFMGHEWDAFVPGPELWREVWRVLKPGGYLLCFSGTRTMDLMGLAVRLAGFESRDSIGCEGVLRWTYGQGFPKSLDVSKAIDRMAGATRPVIGTRKLTGTARIVGGQGSVTAGRSEEFYEGRELRDELEITGPATPEAEEWKGWGTALKPSWEPVLVFRKPLEEDTVAAQVLDTGTGAMNIDGCRVGSTKRVPGSLSVRSLTGYGNTRLHGTTLADSGHDPNVGRWPSNMVITHTPECRFIGTRSAKGGAGTRCSYWPEPCRGHGDAGKSQSGETNHGSPPPGWTRDAIEQVELWECAPGCPAAELNRQSRQEGYQPSWEPVMVFRKPLEENTVAKQVLETGTGAINVDGCRVGTDLITTHSRGENGAFPKRPGEHSAQESGRKKDQREGLDTETVRTGRWPPNTTLTHHPDCKLIGQRRVKTGTAVNENRDGTEMGWFGTRKCMTGPNAGYADEDGTELIDAYECVPGCPIAAMDQQRGEQMSPEGGRWPSNCVLTHHPDCEMVGMKRVRSSSTSEGGGSRPGGFVDTGAEKGSSQPCSPGYADEDGTELVEDWRCVPGCPIAALDEQGGHRVSGGPGVVNKTAGPQQGNAYGVFNDAKGRPLHVYADEGGASRYFPGFSWEPEDFEPGFYYAPKATRRERDEGCSGRDAQARSEAYNPSSTGNPFVDRIHGRTVAKNNHPTVKPLALMRWLVRLVTKKGGMVLDPFCGSGTTGAAAMLEGMQFTGVEREPNFADISQRRIRHAERKMAIKRGDHRVLKVTG